MRITDTTYYEAFVRAIGVDLDAFFENIEFSGGQADLSYRIKASAVYSSNIEGNSVDLNSFMNATLTKEQFKPGKEVREIQDLVQAYEFASTHELTEQNLLRSHQLLSQTLLVKDKRGVYRNDRMGVFDDTGLVYLAIEPEYVGEKMKELFDDLSSLIHQNLSISALFYHAALLHLRFVHIHPFWDGNGRSARLLEKWFLSTSINSRAWRIPAEKYYKEHLGEYYASINLGVNYYELDYSRCLPFLLQLPKAVGAMK
jgi:Fic family protein